MREAKQTSYWHWNASVIGAAALLWWEGRASYTAAWAEQYAAVVCRVNRSGG